MGPGSGEEVFFDHFHEFSLGLQFGGSCSINRCGMAPVTCSKLSKYQHACADIVVLIEMVARGDGLGETAKR